MRKRKSTCGLCKPTKRWKQRDIKKTNKEKEFLKNEFDKVVKLRILKS